MSAPRSPGPTRITVFCSANKNLDPHIFTSATEFASGLARRGWELIYGGAQVGLMGHFADECLKAGAVVRGAITRSLADTHETSHVGLSELVIVDDLFARKRWMNDRGDAFVIFPGGLGTLDEALEVITWKSLGQLDKPILFVNLDGFWQSQINAFQDLSARGVIRPDGLGLFAVTDSIAGVWEILDDQFNDVPNR